MNAQNEFARQLPRRLLFFALGFGLGLAAFAGLTLVAAHFQSDCGITAVLGVSGCADDIVRLGFPLLFLEQGGFAYRANFNVAAFAIDVLFALGVSGGLGLACGWAAGKR
ncbi:MAG: hypothetical protein HYZ49_02285 [Chloroflexi bacterium]|nr:hypothetical protein [Chloroflexota bacterium]